MKPMLNVALRAARNAGELIARAAQSSDLVKMEVKSHNDFVSEVDRLAEQEILNVLQKAFPEHGFLCEESGQIEGTGEGKDYCWIIDPLDGTTNFLYGIPHFSISIALKYKGQIEHGLILDPIRNEEFHASRGQGAYLNNRRIRVTSRKTLDGALLGTGFPFRPEQKQYMDNYLNMLKNLTEDTAGIRRAGSAALDLAYVAAGRLDGFWEFGLNPWDIAAGCLIVGEAGGLVGDFNGGHNYLNSGNVVCGGPKVFKQILKTIRPFVEGSLKD